MTPDRVRQIIGDHLDVPSSSVTDSARLEDLGADSLDRIELVMLFEEELGIDISDDALDEATTVGQVVQYIEERAA